MGFLLGLFIGVTIFIVGMVFGAGIALNNQNEDDNDNSYSEPQKRIKLVLPDFGEFIDFAVECYEENIPMAIKTEQAEFIFMDASMHLNECFNIDNKG